MTPPSEYPQSMSQTENPDSDDEDLIGPETTKITAGGHITVPADIRRDLDVDHLRWMQQPDGSYRLEPVEQDAT